MASLSPPPPQFARCAPYSAIDPVLGHIIIFYSPQSALSPSRIEAHVLSCAGFQSYPKLSLSQSSSLYAAVNHLPLHRQSSDVYRGLAVAVLKYFSDLSKSVKETILRSKSNVAPSGEGQAVAFDEMHAGDLAARLKEVESESLANDLTRALTERYATTLDVDLIIRSPDGQAVKADEIPAEVEALLDLFGQPTHLPFTKLKRAPSKPASQMTRPKSLQDNTESLNRELEELKYTEENYVAKLMDLLENVSKPLKRRSTSRKPESSSPATRDLDALFPPCLERIIAANSAFLEAIRNTEIDGVAKGCIEHFPHFKKPYEEYLRASVDFSHLLGKFTRDRGSSFSKKIQETGEQKLRSLIIEPVQRLPRYSLLIDNMINLLPQNHAAITALSDARDVITEICSLQSSEKDERTTTVKRLHSLIISWPPSLKPTGRLVTAVDFVDVLPPYNDNTSEAITSILLLFPDCAVILRRPKSTSMLARGIMAEVDKPGGGPSFSGSGSKRDGLGHDLQFAGWVDLGDVKVAGSDGGAVAWITLIKNLRDSWDVRAGGMGMRKMRLLNAYEGRASKLEEDFAKARLERRITSSTKGVAGIREARFEALVVWGCVWGNEGIYTNERSKGSVAIFLDVNKTSSGRSGKDLAGLVGQEGVDIVVAVEPASGQRYRIEFRSWSDYSSMDIVSADEFMATFTKRLWSLLRQHSSSQHPPITAALMSANRKLLRSLGFSYDGEGRFSKLRPPSPVKLLSFLGSSPAGPPGSPTRSKPVLDRSQSQLLVPRPLERTPRLLQRGATVVGLVEDGDTDDNMQKITMSSGSPLQKLEDTFEAFINILKMIGNTNPDLTPLHDVAKVDEKAVEALVEQMVADPKRTRVEKDMGIDLVFVAFSRFLGREWVEGMGNILDRKALTELLHKSDTCFPGDFEDFFKIFILDWTPQNKRAFKTLVLLLKDTQDKIKKEEDKGALTKAFTELLVGRDVNALDYMGLVDRLVESAESLFKEAPPEISMNGSVRMKRSKTVNSGSLSSTASLRKRFGLSHAIAASAAERDIALAEPSKSHTLWRTLSKNNREKDKEKDKEKEKDIAKSRIGRSKSIDYDARSLRLPRRPTSQDGSTILGGQGSVGYSSSPLNPTPYTPVRPLSTIFSTPESEKKVTTEPPHTPSTARRKKRRSSLSDLTNHPDYQQIKTPALASPADIRSTLRAPELDSPGKESSPSPKERPASSSSDKSTRTKLPEPLFAVREKREIPLRKPVSSRASTTPQRLRMQSPQKLRERLQNEQQAINKVDNTLQQEIDKIAEELKALSTSSPNGTENSPNSFKELSSRLSLVEAKVTQSNEKASQSDSLRKEAQRALRRKERELQGLGKLVNDCQAENDIMFDKFNEELDKLSSAIKTGKAEDELARILQETTSEQGKLKNEIMKLRKENISLRAQIEEGSKK